ncbi:MAG: CapA family protein [Parvibaculum sp.]|uniref:CapA family protein n=1 Tax=Parvibaculum sp. TaxID=2024848 RepID=UPI003C7697C0
MSARPDDSGSLRLFLAGDVMLGRGVDRILPHPGDPRIYESHMRSAEEYVRIAEAAHGTIPRGAGHAYVWGDAAAALDRLTPDLRIVNLETAVTVSRSALPKGINYRMHPRNAEALRAFRIDACSLANNHTLDWGEDGLIETLATLHRLGIATAGAGRGAAEAVAPAILMPARGGRVLLFAAAMASSGTPDSWAARETRPGLFLIDDLSKESADGLARRIAAARAPGDVVVLSLHWSGNWGYDLSPEEIAFAHALIDRAGVDILHGHSSHHPKAVEVHHGKLVLYGCGDFVNDYEGIGGYEAFRGDLVLGYLARIDPADGTLKALSLLPFRLRKFRLERASAEERLWLQNMLSRECARFGPDVEQNGEAALRLVWPEQDAKPRRN